MFYKVMEFSEDVFTKIQKRIATQKYYKALNEIVTPLKTYAGGNLAVELGVFEEVTSAVKTIINELAESDKLDIERLNELYCELKDFLPAEHDTRAVNCTVNFLREIIMLKLIEVSNYTEFNKRDVVSSFRYFMTPVELVAEIDQLSYEEWPYFNFYQESFKPFLEKASKLFVGAVERDLAEYLIAFESDFNARVASRYTQLVLENKSSFNEDRFIAALKLFGENKFSLKQKEREHKSIYEILKQQNFNFSSPFILPFKESLLKNAVSDQERDQIFLMLSSASILGRERQAALELLDQVQDTETKLLFLMDNFKQELYSLKYTSLFLEVFSKDASREDSLIDVHLKQVVQYELERQNEKAVLAFIVSFFEERARKPYLEEAIAIVFKSYVEKISDLASLAKAIEMINFFETEYSQYTLLIDHQSFTALMRNYNKVFFNNYNKQESFIKIEKLVKSLKNSILRNEMEVSFAIYFQHISIAKFMSILKERVLLITSYTIGDRDNSYVYYSAFVCRKAQAFLREFNITRFDAVNLKTFFAKGLALLTEIKENITNNELEMAQSFISDLRQPPINVKQKRAGAINYGQEIMAAFNGLLSVIEKSQLFVVEAEVLREWYHSFLPENKNKDVLTKRRSSRRG